MGSGKQKLCKDNVSAAERASFAHKTVLVTGANSGLGLECCEQLAESGWGRIILACHNKARGQDAIKELEKTRGNNVFELLIFDIESKASCIELVNNLTGVLDCVVFNAGKVLHPSEALKLSPDGYSTIVAMHLLGPITLSDAMISFGKLAVDATIIYVSTEGVRGVKALGISPALLPADKDEVDKFVVGDWRCNLKANGKWDGISEYGTSKSLATLWFSALARKLPQFHVFSVSPGAIHGTQFFSQPGKCVLPWIAPAVYRLMSLFRMSQPLECGSDRYVQLANRPSSYQSGTFYASVSDKPTGPMGPQAHFHPMLEDEKRQEMLFEALGVHAYMDSGLHPDVARPGPAAVPGMP